MIDTPINFTQELSFAISSWDQMTQFSIPIFTMFSCIYNSHDIYIYIVRYLYV